MTFTPPGMARGTIGGSDCCCCCVDERRYCTSCNSIGSNPGRQETNAENGPRIVDFVDDEFLFDGFTCCDELCLSFRQSGAATPLEKDPLFFSSVDVFE